MCIPSCLALYLKALHRFIAIKGVFDASSQHMMNAGMSIGRGRTLIENKLRTTFSFINRFMENIILLPLRQYIFIGLSEIECFILGKFLSHTLYLILYTFNY